MIKFSLPGYIENELLIGYFFDLQKNAPHFFIENRCLDSAYGMPGHMIWNGGRSRFNLPVQGPEIYQTINYLHEHGVKLRHTCTNMLLTQGHLYDWTCNQFISYCEQEGDSIIVFAPELANYIREKYPKYNIIWSTTRRDDDINIINNLSQTDMLVLDYKYNKDYSVLASLKNPKNIEIVCGENCVPDCPARLAHYADISRHQLLFPNIDEIFTCPYNREKPFNFYEEIQRQPHAILDRDIEYLYNQYGIENFKISGRTITPHLLIEMILYYTIKPEYRDTIRQTALYLAYEKFYS